MKEYWVNVYNDGELGINRKDRDRTRLMNIGIKGDKAAYRLHVREFETREAKELYLKMKYGMPTELYKDYKFRYKYDWASKNWMD